MSSVLTLVSAPNRNDLDSGIIRAIRAALGGAGATPGEAEWLAPGIACDISFQQIDPSAAQDIARSLLQNRRIDCYAQPVLGRKKRLLVCDMDATIVTGETLDDLSVFVKDKAAIDALTQKSVNGEISFTESLLARAELLKGLTEKEFAAAYAKVELSAGATTLIRTLRQDGAYTALVSGGFRYFTSRVRDRVGFFADIANDFEMKDGRTTGKLIPPIVDPDGEFGKLGRLKHLAKKLGLDLGATAAIGDGANDIPMLAAAGLGCAYRGKEKVRTAIRAQLNHADLTGLLYFMGYRQSEFVA
jgi:phosphoserine phosphatase